MALDERYRWAFEVTDVHGREVTVGIGIEDGNVIVSAPRWYKADPVTAQRISVGYAEAAYIAASQGGWSQSRPPGGQAPA